jgi:hypothetical protein
MHDTNISSVFTRVGAIYKVNYVSFSKISHLSNRVLPLEPWRIPRSTWEGNPITVQALFRS